MTARTEVQEIDPDDWTGCGNELPRLRFRRVVVEDGHTAKVRQHLRELRARGVKVRPLLGDELDRQPGDTLRGVPAGFTHPALCGARTKAGHPVQGHEGAQPQALPLARRPEYRTTHGRGQGKLHAESTLGEEAVMATNENLAACCTSLRSLKFANHAVHVTIERERRVAWARIASEDVVAPEGQSDGVAAARVHGLAHRALDLRRILACVVRLDVGVGDSLNLHGAVGEYPVTRTLPRSFTGPITKAVRRRARNFRVERSRLRVWQRGAPSTHATKCRAKYNSFHNPPPPPG